MCKFAGACYKGRKCRWAHSLDELLEARGKSSAVDSVRSSIASGGSTEVLDPISDKPTDEELQELAALLSDLYSANLSEFILDE